MIQSVLTLFVLGTVTPLTLVIGVRFFFGLVSDS
jgi:hypothetical protein